MLFTVVYLRSILRCKKIEEAECPGEAVSSGTFQRENHSQHENHEGVAEERRLQQAEREL